MKKYINICMAVLFVTTAVTAQIDRSKMPQSGPAPTINLSVPQTFTMDNGLEVMVVENHKLPRVRIQLLMDNPMHASGNKTGVESLLSAMLGNGTTSISKEDYNEEIDYLGARVAFGSESAFAQSLSKYFPRVLELLADGIKNPLLTEEEFQKEKTKLLENLKNQEKDVPAIASRVNSALLYGKDHPKGEFVTPENVENLSLADVKNYFDTYFSPKNAYLVIVGDVSYNDVERLVREHLADWNSGSMPMVSYAKPQDVQYTQVNFIDMPNAVQSEIAVQNLVDLKMSDPDYHAVLIANKILGGGFNSLLNMNLREEHGWTYGARSYTGADKNITRFIASTSVRNMVTDSAVAETLKEIHYIRNNDVTQQQLANAKAKFTGDFVLALERPETIANYALEIETQDLDKNFYKDYLKKINEVTAADVRRVANKYFDEDNLRIVVTGKGSEVLEGLKNLKNPEGKSVPIKYYDKNANPVDEPNYNMEMEEGVTAATVIADYIDAIGGVEAVKAVNTLVYMAEANMGGMLIGYETKNTTKNQFALTISMGGNPMQQMKFDGTKGYTMAQGQRMDFDEKQNANAKQKAQPFMELTAEEAKLERMEQVDGNDAYVISFGNSGMEAYYDKSTGLKVKETNTEEQMGQQVKTATLYSDYQAVDGVMLPHTVIQSMGPREITFKVKEILINEGVSDEDFD
ncbi:MAG: insulinase family protein [Flavobacteriaceae bacterium]|nr:insulinase family protein [Flavobacteriaceae bacterium]